MLSPDEVARRLQATAGPGYRAALSVAYGAGLYASDVTALTIGDIDSARMTIHVEQGKGRRDRFALLSPVLLTILRAWWQGRGRTAGCFLDATPPLSR